MVIEPNDFDEIAFLLLALLQLLLNDFFESVDDELLDEGWRCVFSFHELFIGLCVEMEALHVEESKGDVELSGVGEFLDSLLIHTLQLDDQQLAILVHLREHLLLLGFLHFYWAILFNTRLDVLLDVAH